MKNFENKYKEFFKNVNLTDNEYDEIKNNVLNNKKTRSFKLKYAYILLLVVFVSFAGIVSASKIINHMKIDINEERGIKKITSEAVIDKDYDSRLFEEKNYYTYAEIEEKLGFKLLKSDYYDSDLFKVYGPSIKDGKIASIAFGMVNRDKSSLKMESSFFISIDTKIASKEPDFLVSGNTYFEKYYIKSLGVEVSIIYLGNPCTAAFVHFVYNNVFYSLGFSNDNYFDSYEDFAATANEKQKEDIIKVLESLTLE